MKEHRLFDDREARDAEYWILVDSGMKPVVRFTESSPEPDVKTQYGLSWGENVDLFPEVNDETN